MKTQLGHTYRDIITGYEGVATGRVEYITGCNQALLTSRDIEKPADPRWLDEQRLVHVAVEPVVLDNGNAPGCDMPAPIR